MGLIQQMVQSFTMIVIGYLGIFSLSILGVQFGPLIFTFAGFLVIASLAVSYSFYFKL